MRSGILAAVTAGLLAGAAQAQTCRLPEATRATVEGVLCGRIGAPDAYAFEGRNCFALSAARRFEDSAAQIARLSACGEDARAADLREATEAAAAAMAALAPCAPEAADPQEIFVRAEEIVARRPGVRRCLPEDRRLIAESAPDLQPAIDRARAPGAAEALEAALGVTVTETGDVVPR